MSNTSLAEASCHSTLSSTLEEEEEEEDEETTEAGMGPIEEDELSLDFCLDYAHGNNTSQAPYTMTRQATTINNRTLLLHSNLASNNNTRSQRGDLGLRPSSSCPRLGFPKYKFLSNYQQEHIRTVDVYGEETGRNADHTVSVIKSCKKRIIIPFQRLLILVSLWDLCLCSASETSLIRIALL
ncbi:hypothetical protein Ciccas_000854 [Cichlidogyrus casuarinus]|uniref:Uncharacterized protein n=1 Tax=Cichlidogyrus casuarinus TaxID=1844966 RepID=A0ABD2QNZ4_9PLAT